MQITPLEVGGGGGGEEGEYSGNNNGQFLTFYYNLLFCLIKAQLLLKLFRKIELILRK